jgi:hypothetical protein
MAFFCTTACADVTDMLTTSRLFYKPKINIITHSEFKLLTVLTSAVSGNSEKLRP